MSQMNLPVYMLDDASLAATGMLDESDEPTSIYGRLTGSHGHVG